MDVIPALLPFSMKESINFRFEVSNASFAHTRNRYFNANNMKDLFENINMEDILSFFNEIKLYHRI